MPFTKPPDLGWIPFIREFIGWWIVTILGALAFAIALGKVHEESSHGLSPIIGTFQTLAGAYAGFAFGQQVGRMQEKMRQWEEEKDGGK